MTFCSLRTAMIHNFGDHRLRTNRDRRFIVRRQPTTYTQRSPLYRLAIILAFRLSSSTSPLTSNDLLFFKDGDDAQLWRSPITYEWRSPLHSATTDYIHTEIAALSTGDVSSSTSPLSSNDLLFIKDGDGAQLWRPPTTYAQFQHFI